jgi:hypothetical protein
VHDVGLRCLPAAVRVRTFDFDVFGRTTSVGRDNLGFDRAFFEVSDPLEEEDSGSNVRFCEFGRTTSVGRYNLRVRSCTFEVSNPSEEEDSGSNVRF